MNHHVRYRKEIAELFRLDWRQNKDGKWCPGRGRHVGRRFELRQALELAGLLDEQTCKDYSRVERTMVNGIRIRTVVPCSKPGAIGRRAKKRLALWRGKGDPHALLRQMKIRPVKKQEKRFRIGRRAATRGTYGPNRH